MDPSLPATEAHRQLLEQAAATLTQNYRQQPVVLTHGQGVWVWDDTGRKYLDFVGGIAACPLGHASPALVKAVSAQAAKLLHVSNLYYNEPQIRLAGKLAALAVELTGARTFYCNSGAEANEAALKLAKRYQTTIKGHPERIEIFSFVGSFHGRSIATVALTGQEKYRSGFGPLVEWARFLPWPGEGASQQEILARITEHTCAVIIEPIQAEGGIRVPPAGFLAALRARCTETGTVLIFDEVQTGIGRTGTWFGYQNEGVVPDIISLAKGLGGGVPIGAIVARSEIAEGFTPGSHASTFGGNPLACAAALCVLAEIDQQNLLHETHERGAYLREQLTSLVNEFPAHVREVRGRGLLLGLVFDRDVTPIVTAMRERGVLLSAAGGTVLRFVPPLIVTDGELAQGIAVLRDVLATFDWTVQP